MPNYRKDHSGTAEHLWSATTASWAKFNGTNYRRRIRR